MNYEINFHQKMIHWSNVSLAKGSYDSEQHFHGLRVLFMYITVGLFDTFCCFIFVHDLYECNLVTALNYCCTVWTTLCVCLSLYMSLSLSLSLFRLLFLSPHLDTSGYSNWIWLTNKGKLCVRSAREVARKGSRRLDDWKWLRYICC